MKFVDGQGMFEQSLITHDALDRRTKGLHLIVDGC